MISALLEYTPTQRLSAVEAMCHPFFDELRDPACRFPDSRHPNGVSKEMPRLFDFSKHGRSFASTLGNDADLSQRAVNCPGEESSPSSATRT